MSFQAEDETASPKGAKHYSATCQLPVRIEDAFAYHERPGCLNRLTPPWESVRVEHSDNSLASGSRVVLKTKVLGVPLRWRAKHVLYDPPRQFADIQESGPFAFWHHRHLFDSIADDRSTLTDSIDYKLPAGSVGNLFGGGKARQTIEAMFAYRHRITQDDLALMAKYPTEGLTVAVSGSTGLVGQSLCSLLTLLGHKVMPIVRDSSAGENAIAAWGDESETAKFNDVDVVVHLAGKSIASARWTPAVKQEIRDSRVGKTRILCERLASLPEKRPTLICASATGLYGDRGEEILVEESSVGDDFLAGVAEEWEAACDPARAAGCRVVHARFGVVVSPNGGALEKMLFPAKMMGGALGNGRQWWSWIALEDVVGGIVHAMHTPSLSGGVNFVAPEPIRNCDFAKTLGRVLGRPALVPAPAFGLRLALGEMADALLLASSRAVPNRLLESGYEFRFTDLESCLRFYLGKERLESSAKT